MRLVSISDGYIELLRSNCGNVMDNKYETRIHSRKYLGVVLTINEFDYYVPLSSPKPYDYLEDGSIKKSNMFCLRIVMNTGDEKYQLYGKLMYKNMIPVPSSVIEEYDVESEEDEKYKAVVQNELVWISLHIGQIQRFANRIYSYRKDKRNVNDPRIEKVMDFELLEKACNTYSKLVK